MLDTQSGIRNVECQADPDDDVFGGLDYDECINWDADVTTATADMFADEQTLPEGFRPRLYTISGEMVELLCKKNAAYGDSFSAAAEILRHLYPKGVAPEQYTDALAIVRVVDKLKRIATAKDALGESPWRDIAGYALLSLEKEGRGRR